MAKKEESTVQTKASKNKNETKNSTIIKETITYDNTPIFNKMLICLYIIIALLALNIIITAINISSSGTSSSKPNTTTPTSAQSTTSYDVSKFKAINTEQFIDAYKGSETKLIYLGRPDCGYCVKFVPILTEVQEKYNFETLYLDINTVGKDDVNKIIELNNEFFTGENTAYGYTPMTLIVKDNKILDSQIGASNASTLEALVSKYFDKK